jgi:hypothetical protein
LSIPVEPALGGAGVVAAGDAPLPAAGAGFVVVVLGAGLCAVAVAMLAAKSAAKIIVRLSVMSVFSYGELKGLACARSRVVRKLRVRTSMQEACASAYAARAMTQHADREAIPMPTGLNYRMAL